MTREDRFVLYCVYYAQHSNSNIANVIRGVIRLDSFRYAIERLEKDNYIYDYKINPKMLSKVQSLSRFGDDPMKMREDLFLINLSKSLDRLEQCEIKSLNCSKDDLKDKITSLRVLLR